MWEECMREAQRGVEEVGGGGRRRGGAERRGERRGGGRVGPRNRRGRSMRRRERLVF